MGCTHKWMNNEEEELYCACSGDNCNKDITTVSASISVRKQSLIGPQIKWILISFCLLFLSDHFKILRVF